MIKYECDICHCQFDQSESMTHIRFDDNNQKETFDICSNCKIKIKNISKSSLPLSKFAIGELILVSGMTPDDPEGPDNCITGTVISTKFNRNLLDLDIASYIEIRKTDDLYYYDVEDKDLNIIEDVPERSISRILRVRS